MLRSENGEQAASLWIEDGDKGGDIEVPAGGGGRVVDHRGGAGDLAGVARARGGAPRHAAGDPQPARGRQRGRAAPGGAVEIDADLTDAPRRRAAGDGGGGARRSPRRRLHRRVRGARSAALDLPQGPRRRRALRSPRRGGSGARRAPAGRARRRRRAAARARERSGRQRARGHDQGLRRGAALARGRGVRGDAVRRWTARRAPQRPGRVDVQPRAHDPGHGGDGQAAAHAGASRWCSAISSRSILKSPSTTSRAGSRGSRSSACSPRCGPSARSGASIPTSRCSRTPTRCCAASCARGAHRRHPPRSLGRDDPVRSGRGPAGPVPLGGPRLRAPRARPRRRRRQRGRRARSLRARAPLGDALRGRRERGSDRRRQVRSRGRRRHGLGLADALRGAHGIEARRRDRRELRRGRIGLGGIGAGGHGAGVGYGRGSAISTGASFWSAPQRTDDHGHVRVHVPLGDIETTWRIALVGVPDGARPATTTVDAHRPPTLGARRRRRDLGRGRRVRAAVTLRNRTKQPIHATLAAAAGAPPRW